MVSSKNVDICDLDNDLSARLVKLSVCKTRLWISRNGTGILVYEDGYHDIFAQLSHDSTLIPNATSQEVSSAAVHQAEDTLG